MKFTVEFYNYEYKIEAESMKDAFKKWMEFFLSDHIFDENFDRVEVRIKNER